MVDHDNHRVKTIDGGKVSDEVHRKVLEGAGSLEGKGSDGWDCRMDEYLVCLTNCASRDVFLDIDGEIMLLVLHCHNLIKLTIKSQIMLYSFQSRLHAMFSLTRASLNTHVQSRILLSQSRSLDEA